MNKRGTTEPPTMDPAGLRDSLRPALLAGGTVAVLFFVVLLGWAAVARLDAAAFGEGQVVVAGNRQSVQHRFGGDVEQVLVADGQHVRAGQVLLLLSGPDVLAAERALTAAVIDLQAQRARLEAEVVGRPIRWPASFATATGDDRALVAEAMRLQRAQQASRASLLAASRGVLGEQRDQYDAQIRGYQAQADATAVQRRSLQSQLESTRRLAERGDVSRNTVRALERSLFELDGNTADFAARAAASREQVAGAGQQMAQIRRQSADESATLLRDTQFRLNDALPKWIAAREQLERTVIRAPVGGRVVGLRVFSAGSVVQPGQPILDIVPDDALLEIRANFRPEDIDGVYAGRQAEIKFLSIHDRKLPILLGTIRNVSADSMSDERTGQSRFVAEVVVPTAQVALLRRVRGADTGIRPGIPAQVTVRLRQRTGLEYLLAPLTESLDHAFHER